MLDVKAAHRMIAKLDDSAEGDNSLVVVAM